MEIFANCSSPKAPKQAMIGLHKALHQHPVESSLLNFIVAGELHLRFIPQLWRSGSVESFWCTSLIQFQWISITQIVGSDSYSVCLQYTICPLTYPHIFFVFIAISFSLYPATTLYEYNWGLPLMFCAKCPVDRQRLSCTKWKMHRCSPWKKMCQ